MNKMSPQDRIEEAHGLWELAIVRVSCMVEVGADKSWITEALKEERRAYLQWKAVSSVSIAESETL